MKKIYEINWDGIYTSISVKEFETERANELLEKLEGDYKPTFSAAKIEVLKYMHNQIVSWKEASAELRKLTKENV